MPLTDAPHPPHARHLVCVVAARPNFMKMAPILRALAALRPAVHVTLVHTGQHYDIAMNAQYFAALGLPAPAFNLEVGSGSHAWQTAEVMLRFAPLLEARRPHAVLVVGDVNSTLACALVAAKMGIPVIHVEAGLRSFDRAMPEELNRLVTDQLSELLYVSEPSGCDNLLREGIPAARMHLVGNVMIDTLRHQLPHAVAPQHSLAAAGAAAFLTADGSPATMPAADRPPADPPCAKVPAYALLTLHRPSSVDDPATLRRLMTAMLELSMAIPLIFPVHPRSRAMLAAAGLAPQLAAARILLLPPMGYLEMLGLMQGATLVLTDSGGVQEETTALGVPCITLRENTERPITISEGSNTLAGHDPATILALSRQVLAGQGKRGRVPQLWDGQAAQRIAASIGAWFDRLPAREPV